MRLIRPNHSPNQRTAKSIAARARRFPVQVRATFIRLPRRTSAAAAA